MVRSTSAVVGRTAALGLTLLLTSVLVAQPPGPDPRGGGQPRGGDVPAGGQPPGGGGRGGRARREAPPQVDPAVEAWVKVLVDKMTDRHDTIRESAREALIAVGPPALATLRGLANGDDTATAEAARKVIAHIESRGPASAGMMGGMRGDVEGGPGGPTRAPGPGRTGQGGFGGGVTGPGFPGAGGPGGFGRGGPPDGSGNPGGFTPGGRGAGEFPGADGRQRDNLDRVLRAVAVEVFIVELPPRKADAREKEPDEKDLTGTVEEVASRIDAMRKKGEVAGAQRIQLSTLEGQAGSVMQSEMKPYVVGSVVTGTGRTSSSISYRNVGTSVRVTPHVTADKAVTLDLRVEDNRMQSSDNLPNVGTDDKGNPIRATEFVLTSLDSAISVPSGRAILAKDAKVTSRTGDGRTLIVVGARVLGPESKGR